MYVLSEASGDTEHKIHVSCHVDNCGDDDIRTLLYWPDIGEFKVFEDQLPFYIKFHNQMVTGYGTRQTGYRIGDFDPTKAAVDKYLLFRVPLPDVSVLNRVCLCRQQHAY